MTILLFGATGNAGGAVLKACLADPGVTEVRAVTRRTPAATHPKLRVVPHQDYLDYSPIRAAFQGVDTCLFCLGISVRQAACHTSSAEGAGLRKH
ncbi:MAG TPA: NAD(P)H-binding protein [Vicinamibacterales bacterium]|nr:NAD(P)H-binding protein [Vicinamibacterales bacterium]